MTGFSSERRRFMRQIGATLAAGAGVTLASAAPAHAATTTWRCCTAPRRCGTCPDPDKARYRCIKQSGPCGDFCTSCQTFTDDCYTFSATFCP